MGWFDWFSKKTETTAQAAANVLPAGVKASPAAPEAPGTTVTGGRKRRHRTKRGGKRRSHTKRR